MILIMPPLKLINGDSAGNGPMESLAENEMGALLRIAGEVGELGLDVQARRAHILDGLIHLVGACGAACSEIEDDSGWCVPGSITLAGSLKSHEKMTKSYLTGGL